LKRVELLRIKVKGFRFIKTFWAGLEQHLGNIDFIDAAELSTPFSYQCAKIVEEFRKLLVASVIETTPKYVSSRLPSWFLITKCVMGRVGLLIALIDKEYLLPVGVEEDKVKVLRHGVDLERFHPLKNRPVGD
jgi:hypothetical protein